MTKEMEQGGHFVLNCVWGNSGPQVCSGWLPPAHGPGTLTSNPLVVMLESHREQPASLTLLYITEEEVSKSSFS